MSFNIKGVKRSGAGKNDNQWQGAKADSDLKADRVRERKNDKILFTMWFWFVCLLMCSLHTKQLFERVRAGLVKCGLVMEVQSFRVQRWSVSFMTDWHQYTKYVFRIQHRKQDLISMPLTHYLVFVRVFTLSYKT